MIVINFKNYKSGDDSLNLSKKIEKYLPRAIVAVPTSDIFLITSKTNLKVYAQHVDYKKTKKATGFVLPENVKKEGAKGTLLNHSEHRIPLKIIKNTVQRCNELKIKTIVCAKNINETKKIIKLNPFAIAIEDPKLVGTGKSITQYKSKLVLEFSKLLKGRKIKPLCGAGISSANDISEAYKLGCKGVLIASAIVNVNKPDRLLGEIGGLRK